MAEQRLSFLLTAKDATGTAFRQAKAGLQGIQAAAGSTTAVFGTLGLAVTAAFQTASLANALQVLDSLNELSEKSGVAVESLSALRFAGEQSGVGLEDLGKGLKTLSTNMASAAGGSKSAQAAFDAIGVKVKDANGALRSSDAVLREIADRFATFADGAGKSAIATAIFGKAGQNLIPVLNQGSAGLAEQEKLARQLGAVYGADLAKAADEFSDNLKKIGLAAEATKVSLLGELLPALNAVSNAFIENLKTSGLFIAGLKTIGQGAAARFGLSDTSTDVDKAAQRRVVIGELADELSRVKEAANSATPALAAFFKKRADAVEKELNRLNSQNLQLDRVFGAQLQEGEAESESARKFGKQKTQVPVKDEQAEQRVRQFQALIDKIKERIAAEKAELAAGRELTNAEKFAIAIEADLTASKSLLTDKQREAVRSRAQEAASLIGQVDAMVKLAKAQEEELKRIDRVVEGIEQANGARLQENRSLAQNIEEMGLSEREIEALRTARLENALAVEKGTLAIQRASGASEIELLGLREGIDLLQQQIDLRKKGAQKRNDQEDNPLEGAKRAFKNFQEDVKREGLATERAISGIMGTLEDELTASFSGKGFDAKRVVDQIISEFVRLRIVKPMLAEIFGGGSSSGAGAFLAALFAGGAANGARDVAAGQPMWVGERGERELFVPSERGSIVPQHQLRTGNGSQVVNNYNIAPGVTRAELLAALQLQAQSMRGETTARLRSAGVA